jgi:phage I-like protein
MKQARDSQKRIAFVQLFAEAGSSAVPDEIEVVPTGQWSHPAYGEMEITASDLDEFVQNFNRGLRRDIPITAGHDNGMSGGELPAIGWFTSLRAENGRLVGGTKWTDEGKQLLTSGAFKYFSPEFYETYTDPESGAEYDHVLVGGALTNKPYFKELEPVATFSEPDIMRQINHYMDLNKILAKKASELSKEEKTFLRTHKEELNDEQKTTYASVFDEEGGKSPDGEEPQEEEAVDEPKDEPKEEPKIQGSEVKISTAEYQALKDKADEGAKAFAEVQKMQLGQEVDKLVFSNHNAEGRILPKQKESVVAFMFSLNAKQRDQFRNIINGMPKADRKMFSEIGDGGEAVATDAKTIAAEVKGFAEAKMAANPKLTYSKAVLQVYAEKPELKTAYEAALASESK